MRTAEFFNGQPNRGWSVVLSDLIDLPFIGEGATKPIGTVWRPRSTRHFIKRGRDYLLKKGKRRQERYSYQDSGSFLELMFESGQIGASVGASRVFVGYQWAPGFLDVDSPKRWTFQFRQIHDDFAVHTPTISSIATIRDLSTRAGRAAFRADMGDTHSQWWRKCFRGWRKLSNTTPYPRLGLSVRQYWGQYPGLSGGPGIGVKASEHFQFSEVYFYLRGVGLVGWAVFQGFNHNPHQLMRLTGSDEIVDE